MNGKPRVLRFGIPTLDRLIGNNTEGHGPDQDKPPDQNRFGFGYSEDAGTSFCLIGPHGTGKSVLALHFASRYLADCLAEGDENANVLYVSTDLSYSMAENVWYNFSLDTPNLRRVPFGSEYGDGQSTDQILLQRRTPHSEEAPDANLTHFLQRRLHPAGPCREITFVDLAAETAGDDWGFIHRLIAVLNQPSDGSPRHLVIVDAVEGLETLVGKRDAFGEKTSRRARVAQMLRTAFKKCHLFFVVEEPAEGERVPEEFVSDSVIRLRSVRHSGFDRRTVEVQKVRGQDHVRGQHPYVIRRGVGSFTGDRVNPDDPCVEIRTLKQASAKSETENLQEGKTASKPETPQEKHDSCTSQAYVHVMHSLHFLTRNIMLVKGESRPGPSHRLAAFGITHLDSMLGRNDKDEQGLPCSTATALIGDAGTHKSALGKSFLYTGLHPDTIIDPKQGAKVRNVAILLTTSDTDAGGLARQFLRWAWIEARKQPMREWSEWFLKSGKDLRTFAGSEDPEDPATASELFAAKVKHLVDENIICRRLEIHNQTSEVLMHIVREAVTKAQERIGAYHAYSARRYKNSWPIRLVIDDFSILRNTYAAVREDSLFLPFLILHLKREGVSTLIVDTNPGRPDREGPALFSDELRALADNHLYTWRVGFHGESRIAISAIPPISPDQRSRVRELRWDPNQDQPPTVDRGLELYTGLEQADPHPIPLEVRLYAETDAFADYIGEMNRILGDFFVPVPPTSANPAPSLVVGMKPNEYAYLHDFCNLQAKHRLDHTLILAVDEFWAVTPAEERDPGGNVLPPPLRDETEYLQAELDIFANEPRQLFRGLRDRLASDPPGSTGNANPPAEDTSRGRRLNYFRLPAYSLTEAANASQPDQDPKMKKGIDRVAFAWDFGFLMCRKTAWRAAAQERVHLWNAPGRTVGEILNDLPHTEGQLHNERPTDWNRTTPRPDWREFLGACQAVSARLSTGSMRSLPFDIATLSEESFSCLSLEMWASEIVDRLKPGEAKTFCGLLSKKNWVASQTVAPKKEEQCGLIEWLDNPERVIDLYMAWLLLVDLLPLDELANPRQPTRVLEHAASPDAIASRQWYKGACQLLGRVPEPEPMEAVGLPGHFSTRGDWFLGVAQGSKSDLLADRVLDIFSSRRNNLTRLYSGLGLPTRILGAEQRRMTALTWKDASGEPRSVRYGPLLALGAAEAVDKRTDQFHWLFRSTLRNYHRHARIFQRWNSRTVLMWNQTRTEAGANWRNGFAVYDELKRLGKGTPPETYGEMNKKMEQAMRTLKVASVKDNSWIHFKRRCVILKNLLINSDKTGPEEEERAQAAGAGA